MSEFSSPLAIVCVILAVLMLVVSGVAHDTALDQLIMSAIGFAVAAIPEGLPAVIAITLALGVQATAGQNALTLFLALSFEPAEPDIMRCSPRDPNSNILDRGAFARMVYVSLLLGALTFWAFSVSIDNGVTLERARTIAVNSLAVGQIFYLLATRFFRVSALRRELFTSNPISWLCIAIMLTLQLAFAYLPFMNPTFDTAPVALDS